MAVTYIKDSLKVQINNKAKELNISSSQYLKMMWDTMEAQGDPAQNNLSQLIQVAQNSLTALKARCTEDELDELDEI